jgi:hypothetical protein
MKRVIGILFSEFNRENLMKIPCAKRLPFIVCGLSFLQPALTSIQFDNLTLIATALVLGARFNLSEINRMWLAEKCVSTLSYFMSDAKFFIPDMQRLYAKHVRQTYPITDGFFIIDDTMKHHTLFCKWIHGVFILFDHALKTNLKATCIVFLYYSDGALIKFPIGFRIFYKDSGKPMPWHNRKSYPHKKKYELAIEMLEWALKMKFPKSIVLADSWYGIGPFVKELKRLELGYVLEIKVNYKVKTPCTEPKLTPTGRYAKNQFELITLPEYFKSISSITRCGFAADQEHGNQEKILYHLKITTARLNSFNGKHRIVESFDPAKQTTKYLLTDRLSWEAIRIVSTHSHRWVIEEFFRNAKQLTDMEGATIRSEQGVTLALCLVSWIDFLLHLENFKQSTTGKLTKESVTIPSIVRRAQYENQIAFLEKLQNDPHFGVRWLEIEKQNIYRKRKTRKQLIPMDKSDDKRLDLAA